MKFTGKVIRGAGRGKALGFPTANLDVKTDLEEGIYAANVITIFSSPLAGEDARRAGEGKLPSLVFIGAAKTFGESERKVEVYILDFSGDLYGRELEVEIVKKLRDNQKFDSAEALAFQMKQDEQEARACLA